MRADQILSERPAPVAPLPPWGIPKSVTFSMARSVIFSMAIDTWASLQALLPPALLSAARLHRACRMVAKADGSLGQARGKAIRPAKWKRVLNFMFNRK